MRDWRTSRLSRLDNAHSSSMTLLTKTHSLVSRRSMDDLTGGPSDSAPSNASVSLHRHILAPATTDPQHVPRKVAIAPRIIRPNEPLFNTFFTMASCRACTFTASNRTCPSAVTGLAASSRSSPSKGSTSSILPLTGFRTHPAPPAGGGSLAAG